MFGQYTVNGPSYNSDESQNEHSAMPPEQLVQADSQIVAPGAPGGDRRRYKRGQHPDKLRLGSPACPKCRFSNTLVVEAGHNDSVVHICRGRSCRGEYKIICPGHNEGRCVLPRRVNPRPGLGKCRNGHENTWVRTGGKGPVEYLECLGPPPNGSRYLYCGAKVSWRHGPQPKVPTEIDGANPTEFTRYRLLLAFATNLNDGLTLKEAQEVSGLNLGAVQACSKRLRTNSLPLLEFAGEKFDPASCRIVNQWRINVFGLEYVKHHKQRGTFQHEEAKFENRKIHQETAGETENPP